MFIKIRVMHDNVNSEEVTEFLNSLDHQLKDEIEILRKIILSASKDIRENIKWKGPNYTAHEEDRITMKIHPPNQIQLIFHLGAKKREQPDDKIIPSHDRLLAWRGNDRAIASFKDKAAIENAKNELQIIIREWVRAGSEV